MTRLRNEPVTFRATNNIYTALTGAATVAVLAALVLAWLKWQDIAGENGPKLFFGLF